MEVIRGFAGLTGIFSPNDKQAWQDNRAMEYGIYLRRVRSGFGLSVGAIR